MRTKQFILEAGNASHVPMTGNYIRCLADTRSDAFTVEVKETGKVFEMTTGLGIESSKPFTGFSLLSANARTITLAVGSGRVDDGRLAGSMSVDEVTNIVSLDLVDVITVNKLLERDESKYYDTLNNQDTFFGYSSLSGAASNYTAIQIFNPAASGVYVIVKSIIATIRITTGTIMFGIYDTALTTNETTLRNKFNGGAAPSGQIRSQNAVTQLITGAAHAQAVANSTIVNDKFPFIEEDWLLLDENKGFTLVNGNVNTASLVHFEWMEKAK